MPEDDDKPDGKFRTDEHDEIDDSDDDGAVRASISRLPDKPHPAVERLEELSFEILPENFFVIVYGARRTGKTHSVSVLLEQIKDRFDFAYLFSNTALIHQGEQGELDFDMIVDEAKFQGFDQDALQRIMDRQKAVKKHNNRCERKRDKKPNRTLIIFDDFVHEKEVRYSRIFTELPVLGRHYDLSVICLTQGYSQVASGGLNKATRQNSDLVMTFLPRNLNDLERISEWYLTKEKVENMWFTRSVCQEKHRLLAIDLTEPSETEYENYAYKYVAPEQVPKYELGRVQWKLLKEELKRQKKAALAAKVESERAFFLGLGEMEKRQRIGEATGLPNKRARLSLFDAVAMTGNGR